VVGQTVGRADGLPDLVGDERRVSDRRELDPERAGLVIADELGGGLDREAGLAGAAGAGERDEPGTVTADQADYVLGLPLPADERACWPRQVRVRDRLQRGEPLHAELEDRDRPLEVLEAVLAEVVQCVVRESGSRASRLGQQHLPAVTGRPDPRAEMDVLTDVPLRSEMRRASVDPNANVDPAGAERLAAFLSRGDRLGRVGEREEERVALRVDFDAAVALIRLAEQSAVFG
jgi:hypothetical protein